QLPGAAAQRGFEVEQHLRVMILAASGTEGAAAPGRAASPLSAEQRLEEIAIGRFAAARAAEFETCAPVGWRPKVLAGLRSLSELIVGGALLGALEHFVGFAQVLEACFGVLFL